MSQCPKCAGTDVCDLLNSDKMVCLDCDFEWMPGARKRINRAASRSRSMWR